MARSCRVSFFLVFHRAWPDLQRMKLLLPGGAVLPCQFPPSQIGLAFPDHPTSYQKVKMPTLDRAAAPAAANEHINLGGV